MADVNPFAPIVAVVVDSALWGIPILVGLSSLRALLLPKLRSAHGERTVGRALERLCGEVLHDLVIADGRGGLTQLDHVTLTREGLLVVETKHDSGAVFGREQDARWTQRLGGRSYRFQNPLRQNYLHVAALQALQLGVPVQGRVVFTDAATVPKGIPEGASVLRSLRRDLGGLATSVEAPAAYAAAWDRLRQSARTDRQARKEHLDAVRERNGGDLRSGVAWILLTLSVTWLAVLWLRSDPPTVRPQPVVTQKRQLPADVHRAPTRDPGGYDPARTVRSPGSDATASVAEIAWSDQRGSDHEECSLATAAVLIDHSVDSRKRRDRACAANRSVDRPAPD